MKSVYNIHSTFEIEYDTIRKIVDEFDTPDGVERFDITNNNRFTITAVPDDSVQVGRYTPTANIRGTIMTRNIEVGVENEGDGLWSGYDDEEKEYEEVEYVAFKGKEEKVIKNESLRYQMFLLMEELALNSDYGFLKGLISDGNIVKPVFIKDGEYVDSTIDIVKNHGDNNW